MAGNCRHGSRCLHAHSESEIRPSPDFRKTKLCRMFQKGLCHDNNCRRAHGEHERRIVDQFYKTKLCKYWRDQGTCIRGSECYFAHNESEMKPPVRDDEEIQRTALSLSTRGGARYNCAPAPSATQRRGDGPQQHRGAPADRAKLLSVVVQPPSYPQPPPPGLISDNDQIAFICEDPLGGMYPVKPRDHSLPRSSVSGGFASESSLESTSSGCYNQWTTDGNHQWTPQQIAADCVASESSTMSSIDLATEILPDKHADLLSQLKLLPQHCESELCENSDPWCSLPALGSNCEMESRVEYIATSILECPSSPNGRGSKGDTGYLMQQPCSLPSLPSTFLLPSPLTVTSTARDIEPPTWFLSH